MKRIYSPTKRKRILIVGDDPLVASVYQHKLEKDRYDVEIACDIRHALRMLEMERFDLVILDLSLSEMNGVGFLDTIYSQSLAQESPIIVLSNGYPPALSQVASQRGAIRRVRKSDCTPNEMSTIVREVFAAGALPAIVTPSLAAASTTAVTLPVAESSGIRSAESAGLEIEYQASLVADFHAHAPQKLGRLRAGHQLFNQSQKEDLRLVQLLEMQQQARLLAAAAAIAGFRKIAQLAGALEALLFQLHGKPASITPSAIRTVAQSVDLLDSLCNLATGPDSEISISPAILVVDDEVISRETICSAIERTGFATVSLDDPMKAEELLKQTRFDLIFLDIEMPGQSGLDLCASIRTMATNRATPVVFVTGHSDFDSWAQSSLRGGNDFITKPFLPGELAVKALIWLFKETLPLLPATDLTDAKGQSHPALVIS